MARTLATDDQRRQGRQLAQRLRQLRGSLTSDELARRAHVPVDTLRKIEAGTVSAPGFFTVGQIVEAAGGRLDVLWRDTRDATGGSEDRP